MSKKVVFPLIAVVALGLSAGSLGCKAEAKINAGGEAKPAPPPPPPEPAKPEEAARPVAPPGPLNPVGPLNPITTSPFPGNAGPMVPGPPLVAPSPNPNSPAPNH